VYKDLDFGKTFGHVNVDEAAKVLDALEKDSALFECREIMDYSLLLVICKKNKQLEGRHVFHGDVYSYCIGVIDFLQLYNLKKKIETFSKSIRRPKEEVSSINAHDYRRRFLAKMHEIIKPLKLK
jgi:hypothetical protein